MGLIRDSFVMFKNWSEAIDALPEEYQLECYKAVAKYGLTGEIPEDISPITKAMLISFSVGMENSICRYNASVENGKKGGRPKKETQGNQETQQNLEKPDKTQQNQTEPTQNLNVNDNVNVNVSENVNIDKLVKNSANANIFDNYTNAGACGRVKERSIQERRLFIDLYQEFFDWCYVDKFKEIAFEIIDTMIEAREQAMVNKTLRFNHHKYSFKDMVDIVAKIDCDKFRSIITQLAYNEEINHRPLYILGCIIKASESPGCSTSEEQLEKYYQDMENICS